MNHQGKKYPPVVLAADEVRALMAACSRSAPTGIRDRALIALLWRTGLRISEALDLRPGDVDAKRGTVRVGNGKGGKHRTVGIDDDALVLVERWQDVRSARGISGRAPLFCTITEDEPRPDLRRERRERGTRLSGQQVRAMLKRRAARAGVERRVSPHAFRHTMSAEWVEEGRTLQQIQAQLGHASLDGTAHYLRKIAPVDLVRIARDRPKWDAP